VSTDDAVTLGSALRAAREAAGRTIEQVSADTRIRGTLVRDLESDRFASCGGSVYARGHIKSIAAALHTDPAPLLALFDGAEGTAVETFLEPEAVPRPMTSFGGSALAASTAELQPERRGPRWGIALAGAAAALVGITTVGYFQQSPARVTEAGSVGTGRAPAPSGTTPAVGQKPNRDSVASKPPVTGAQLRVRLIGGVSWVSISNATTTLFEGILQDGEFRDFNDPTRLKVVIGNAPAVNLNCGGRDSGPAGANNRKVRRFACTATGLTPL